MRKSITIVGASLAGLRGAEALRRDGFDGPISLIGDEPHAPYDRPPLSKKILAGDWEADRAALTPAERFADLNFDLRLGSRATKLNVDSQTLWVDGEPEAYQGLLIATGARCRTLPGTEGMNGVHTLRSLNDCLAIRTALEAGPRRLVVVGAGFIGAEVAATAVGRGVPTTLIESLAAPLERVVGNMVGEVVAEVHRSNGVDLRCGVGVTAVHGREQIEAVELTDGTIIETDLLVVGIGVLPNTEWLEGSGLTIENGVVCDETCLAAPGVTAAGDVARWLNPRYGELMRVEHWDNAVEQGPYAARRLLVDQPADPFTPVPWFWSDQFDRKIQLAGRPSPDDEIQVGNRPRQVMQGKNLLAQGASWQEALAVAAAWE